MKKEKQPFDFTKYGFKLHRDSDGFKVYRFAEANVIIELSILGSSISMDFIEKDKSKTVICNRYTCETNKQVEFLLLNGKAGFWIKVARRDSKIKERMESAIAKLQKYYNL